MDLVLKPGFSDEHKISFRSSSAVDLPPACICLISSNFSSSFATFSVANFETEARSPKPAIFSESRVHKKFRGYWPRKIFGYKAFYQKFTFLGISMSRRKKCHIASLNRHTPNFSGVGLKLTWCQLFAVQGLPK